ncbi:hypothetical protein M089_4127 [Bacteroides ovatus str. 3725 D9 iii]|nr:hypothetical protein M082_1080 [Bacteroides fragilis str. 3725 D9 ii]KDS24304.1 hypothetical protein M088_5036 [Bacteroides ovatus str. 3725 D1 iv]KDS27194.1 hypothetical protein M089_4127 [Bacteroides ovatus str. 3725 D9 iii]
MLKSFNRIPILFFRSHTAFPVGLTGRQQCNTRDTNALDMDMKYLTTALK